MRKITGTFQIVSFFPASERHFAESPWQVSDESRFRPLPETGNGLIAQAVEKPQCFKDIGGLVLFSVAPSESSTKPDGARFQAEELSGVSRKDATG